MRKRFGHLQKYCTAIKVCNRIGRNHDVIYAKTNFNKKFTNGEFSDYLCDSVNRGLT